MSKNLCVYSGSVGDEFGGYGIGEAWNLNDEPQNAANARLIAAAPDLLEALDWLLASVTTDQPENYPGDREERLLLATGAARAAIAKALGASDGGHEPSTKGSA